VPQERDAKLVHKRDKLLKEFNKLFSSSSSRS